MNPVVIGAAAYVGDKAFGDQITKIGEYFINTCKGKITSLKVN